MCVCVCVCVCVVVPVGKVLTASSDSSEVQSLLRRRRLQLAQALGSEDFELFQKLLDLIVIVSKPAAEGNHYHHHRHHRPAAPPVVAVW